MPPTAATAPAAPAKVADAPAAPPAKVEDTRPWPVRNWKGLLFASVVGGWVYSLWVGNRSRKGEDAEMDRVTALMPVNNDELLELRALNDAETAALERLPALAAERGCPRRIEPSVLLQLLASAVGHPLREEYALERMLMAIQSSEDETVEVGQGAATLAFLSKGSWTERVQSLFAALCSAHGTSEVTTPMLSALLESMMATGQVPIAKQVCVTDEGKNPLGLAYSWYRVQPVHRFTATELVDVAMGGKATGMLTASPPDTLETQAADDKLDIERFIRVLQSDTICLWEECHRIAERQRIAKQRAETEEYERNPPKWQFWKWGSSPKPAAE